MASSVSNSAVSGSEGTSQAGRFPAALDPSSAPLDGRSAAELTAFARDLADELVFWHGEDTRWSNVSWTEFLPDLDGRSLEEAEATAAAAPQSALFLAFLRLYGLAQDGLNTLTARHLRFYYRDVLGLKPRGPRADHAHLVLGLKKGASELRVPRQSEFTTSDGLRYATGHEIFVHPAEVVHRRVLAREEETGRIVYAAEAASQDGLGTPLPDDHPSWHPFGKDHPLPPAPLGFALSSPVLVLKEGMRLVTVQLVLQLSETGSSALDPAALKTNLKGFFSGETEWIAATTPTDPSATANLDQSTGEWSVTLPFRLDGEAGAVVPYDPTVLEGGFDTLAPVLKILVSNSAPPELARVLSGAVVKSVQIAVSVQDMKDLVVENDYGRLDPSKAFLPFGPQPRAGSSFYIGAEEALTKNVASVRLHITWNVPEADLAAHYDGYTPRGGSGNLVESNDAFTADLEVLREGKFELLGHGKEVRLFEDDAATPRLIDSSKAEDERLSGGAMSFTAFGARFSRVVRSAKLRLPFTNVTATRPFAAMPAAPVLAFRSEMRLPRMSKVPSRLNTQTREGFLRLKLNNGFHHARYPELFAAAFRAEPPNVPPNAPYTPEVESFRLDYTASSGEAFPDSGLASHFEERPVRFFHLTPFGQREEHRHVKETLGAATKAVSLLPALPNAGEFYLGLSGLAPSQSVSLLFQVLDGSANPLSQPPEVSWSVLCSNHWKELGSSSILAESTGHLLKSGVVRLLLPAETTLDNTILEPGLAWIRAAVEEDRSAVARTLAIHPNAVPVTLQNSETASHLADALPEGAIASSASVLRGLKTVEQPYASSGGAEAESERSFRTRTSERLRHRSYAVTAWDFERLVLDAFPELYLVRCLPHTARASDAADPAGYRLASTPGAVTLVVVPDTRGRNVPDPLKPFADTATIAAVKEHVASLHTPFADVAVINPRFVEVGLEFAAAFRSGLPFASYSAILEEELKQHIAPWAYRDSLLPEFGASVVRSALIAFLETLDYIDFIASLRFKLAEPSPRADEIQEIAASSPDAILTSAPSHVIHEA